jgi:peroxiredoxin
VTRKFLFAVALTMLAGIATASGQAGYRDLDNGEARSLSDYQEPGKWLVVMIWASDCPVCNREASHYSDFHLLHADDDATLLGVSIDGWGGRADALSFVERHQVMFPNVIADARDVARDYREITGSRFVGTPTFLLYSPDGELRAKQTGAVPVPAIEAALQVLKHGGLVRTYRAGTVDTALDINAETHAELFADLLRFLHHPAHHPARIRILGDPVEGGPGQRADRIE